jgi:hypothetical protein
MLAVYQPIGPKTRTYLHRTMPSAPCVPIRGSSVLSSQPIAVPWYLLLQTAPRWLYSVSRVGATPASFGTWTAISIECIPISGICWSSFRWSRTYQRNIFAICLSCTDVDWFEEKGGEERERRGEMNRHLTLFTSASSLN